MNHIKTEILFIPGIYLKDLNKTELIKEIKTEIKYNDIPKYFYSVNKWPKKSNLHCWYCDNIPTSYPSFIPINPKKEIIDLVEENDTCEVYGHFDSWRCAVKWVNIEMPKEQRWDLLKSIHLFAKKFDPSINIIIEAVSKVEQKKYIGDDGISENEYFNKNKIINSQHF